MLCVSYFLCGGLQMPHAPGGRLGTIQRGKTSRLWAFTWRTRMDKSGDIDFMF